MPTLRSDYFIQAEQTRRRNGHWATLYIAYEFNNELGRKYTRLHAPVPTAVIERQPDGEVKVLWFESYTKATIHHAKNVGAGRLSTIRRYQRPI
jgi:hypothetical protein